MKEKIDRVTPTAREIIAQGIAKYRTRNSMVTNKIMADRIIDDLDGALDIYEDVYEQLCEMIEPHVQRTWPDRDNNGPFPASVVETMQMLLDHWKATHTERK